MRAYIARAFGLILLCAAALASAQAPPVLTSADFARETSEHFTTQLEAARSALAKSKDPAVRDFASRIASAYEQGGRELVRICEELNIDVPPQPRTGPVAGGAPSATPESSFDKVYTLELSQAFAKANASFDAALSSPKVDPKLKDFAKQQKQALQDYRQRADRLAQHQAGQRTG